MGQQQGHASGLALAGNAGDQQPWALSEPAAAALAAAPSLELGGQQQQLQQAALLSEHHAAVATAFMLAGAGQQMFPFFHQFQQQPTLSHSMVQAFAVQHLAPPSGVAMPSGLHYGEGTQNGPGGAGGSGAAPLGAAASYISEAASRAPSPAAQQQQQQMGWPPGPLTGLLMPGGPATNTGVLAAAFPSLSGQMLPGPSSGGSGHFNAAAMAAGLYLPLGLPLHAGTYGGTPGLPAAFQAAYAGGMSDLGGFMLNAGLGGLPLPAIAPVAGSSVLALAGLPASSANEGAPSHHILGGPAAGQPMGGSQAGQDPAAFSQQAASILQAAYHAALAAGHGASNLAGVSGVVASGGGGPYAGAEAPAGASVQGGSDGVAAACDDANSNAMASQPLENGNGRLMPSNSVAGRPSALQPSGHQHNGSSGYPMHANYHSHMAAAMSLMYQAASGAIAGHPQHQQAQYQHHVASSLQAHGLADTSAGAAGPSNVAASMVAGLQPSPAGQPDTSILDTARASRVAAAASTAGGSPTSGNGRDAGGMSHGEDAMQQHGSTMAVSLGGEGRSDGDDEVVGRRQHQPGLQGSGDGLPQERSSPSPTAAAALGSSGGDRQRRQLRRALDGGASCTRSHSHMHSNGPSPSQAVMEPGASDAAHWWQGQVRTAAGGAHVAGSGGDDGRSGAADMGEASGDRQPQMAAAGGSVLHSMSDVQQELPDHVSRFAVMHCAQSLSIQYIFWGRSSPYSRPPL